MMEGREVEEREREGDGERRGVHVEDEDQIKNLPRIMQMMCNVTACVLPFDPLLDGTFACFWLKVLRVTRAP